MRIPRYEITPETLQLLSTIDSLRLFFSSITVPVTVKQKIQRVSLLKSSLFSARIEGNPLNLDEFENTSDKRKKQEIVNILQGQNYIDKEITPKEILTINHIKKLHELVLKGLSGDAGRLRTEPGAIFNTAGIAIYLSPPPSKIKPSLTDLLNFINGEKEQFPLLNAIISHLVFEKIHPFIDGNGRVGRLLISMILKTKGYEFNLVIPFEEYLDTHKDIYYFHLDRGLTNTNEYLVFMLNAYKNEAEKIKDELDKELSKKEQILLPPRQNEIYEIIKDHKIVSFDEIRRRFLKIPQRTLRYDLHQLSQKGIIVKIGQTRGSYYSLKRI
jgi:Fic family protein